ncbi:MAG: hypothetical protein HKL86_08555 [Acidimicrobiaceae bacterium]|nr:hypothetical protein [Acidimicrobiaceae bacterium]
MQINETCALKSFAKLFPGATTRCQLHVEVDWAGVANDAVSIFNHFAFEDGRGATPWGEADVVSACNDLARSDVWRECLLSLFTEPIEWYPGETWINNGGHRLCALTFANAHEVPVAVASMTGRGSEG